MGFRLVPKSVTLNGIMTADPRYLCGSLASCQTDRQTVVVLCYIVVYHGRDQSATRWTPILHVVICLPAVFSRVCPTNN